MNSNYSYHGSSAEDTHSLVVPGDIAAIAAVTDPEPVICTYTGIAVPILNPQPEHFNISDIAIGLARESRFNGQNDIFINVAIHSIATCRLVEQIAATKGITKQSRKIRYTVLRLAALLHDASEAYLKDLPRPLKKLLPSYQQIQDRFTAAIYAAFDIPQLSQADLAIIAQADNSGLRTEYHNTFRRDSCNQHWGWSDEICVEELYWAEIEALIQCSVSAEKLFLAEYNSILGL